MKPSILLRTKFLIPRPVADTLPRPHLVSWLESQMDKRLILVSAPPGYGKTTLLADFLAASSRSVAWYQLDAADSDPTVFLTYFIESLRRMVNPPPALTAAVGRIAQALLDRAENSISHQQVLTVLLNELSDALDAACLFILEDYHFIASPVVHQLVDFLLENAPPNLHLLLSTRADPPFSLARLRARGMLAELRAADLRFRDDEVRGWMARHLPDLTSGSASLLSEKTEGWAAALQMVRSSLHGQDPESANRLISNLSGSHRFIFEYLAEEIYQRQNAERQTFLLHTAILNQMDAAACESLPGIQSAQSMLEQLERDNLFVTSLDSQRRWYRYHFLFREFLLSKLRREQGAEIPALEQAAAQHYEKLGELEAACVHFLEAREYESAVRVLKILVPDYVERGRVEAAHRFLTALPADVLHAQPNLLLQHGNVHRRLGEAGAAVTAYEDARAAFASRADKAGMSRALTRLAEIHRAQGNYRQAEMMASEALSFAAADDHTARAEALMALAKSSGFLAGMDRGRALAEQAVEEARLAGDALSPLARANFIQSLGQICWWHGDPQATVRYCQEALQLNPDEFSPLAAQAYISLVTPHLYWRDVDTALRYAERGLGIAQQLHLNELLPSAYMALGNVLIRRGEITRAESALRQALEISQRQGLSAYEQIMAAGYLAYNLYGQGRVDEARQIAEGALWAYTGSPDTYEAYVCRSVLADIALENSRLEQAWQLYQGLVEIGERRQFRIPLSLVYFGLAYISLERGEREKGLRYARQSLSLMEPSGAAQLFLDQGERARVVCRALAEAGVDSPFLQRVLEALPHAETPASIAVADGRAILVRCLGNFRVTVAGREVQQDRWVSTKARDLLAYFVTFRGERVPVDRVFEAIWPEADARSRTAFHTALSRLRNALRTSEPSTQFILVEAGEYWLDAARFSVDVDAFDAALAKARNASGEEAARLYEQAIALRNGDYLDNLYYDWLMPERHRLTRELLASLRILAGYRLAAGDPDRALELVQRSLQLDSLQEEVHWLAMRCHAMARDKAGLMRQFKLLEQLLRDELNTEPMPPTKALYQELLSGLE
jgi:LuxR family maltose regulon positive regulatory protein